MRYGWLVLSLSLLMVGSGIAHAAPLDDRDDRSASAWPSFESWKLPTLSMPAPKEPAFIRATREGIGKVWAGTKRTTKSAWKSTKYALRPYDEPADKRRSATVARRDADAGFWSSLFGRRETNDQPVTVNEFLSLPTPY
jgi:hypothetical protein